MKLLFKQRMFSWFDTYDIYDEYGKIKYVVKGQLSWGHLLKIYDRNNQEVGYIKERIITFLPKFEIYVNHNYLGCINKELSFFMPKYNIDFNGWNIEGNWLEWDYKIIDYSKQLIANISKQLFNLTDTYVIDVQDSSDALYALMLVLAIDAEKCSRRN